MIISVVAAKCGISKMCGFYWATLYDSMPITEPNLVTCLNLRNHHLTILEQFYS